MPAQRSLVSVTMKLKDTVRLTSGSTLAKAEDEPFRDTRVASVSTKSLVTGQGEIRNTRGTTTISAARKCYREEKQLALDLYQILELSQSSLSFFGLSYNIRKRNYG